MVDCKGIFVGEFYIPPFHLGRGEVIGINLYNGPCSAELRAVLVGFMEGRRTHANIHVRKPLSLVKGFHESRVRSFIMPRSIRGFVGDEKGFERLCSLEPWLESDMKMTRLPWAVRKWASLLRECKRNNAIIVGLEGLDPSGISKTMRLLSILADEGASIVVIDYWGLKLENCARKYDIARADGRVLSVWKPDFQVNQR